MAAPAQLSDVDRRQSVWASRSFLASIVVVLVLLVGVAVIALNHRGGTAAAAAPGSATDRSGSSTVRTAPNTTIPAVAPAASWADFHGVAIPSSTTAGPTRVAGDVAGGFARTPTGALFAAAQLPIRRILATDWTAVIDASIVPGPGVAAWRQARPQLGTTITPPDGGWTQLAGYRFLAYNPAQAVIQLLKSTTSGDYTVTVETVRWVGGDWKLVLQDDGDDTPDVTAASSPAGFTIWRSER